VRSFIYERPTTLAAAIDLLAIHGEAARPLAGGTDLIIRLRDGTLQPEVVVDLKRVAELRPAIEERDGALVISAGSVMTDIAAHPTVRERFTSLAEAATVIGAVQIRNRATLAGNICNASPAADGVPPLLAMDALIELASVAGIERLPLAGFILGNRRTARRPDQLLTAVLVPKPRSARAGGQELERVGDELGTPYMRGRARLVTAQVTSRIGGGGALRRAERAQAVVEEVAEEA